MAIHACRHYQAVLYLLWLRVHVHVAILLSALLIALLVGGKVFLAHDAAIARFGLEVVVKISISEKIVATFVGKVERVFDVGHDGVCNARQERAWRLEIRRRRVWNFRTATKAVCNQWLWPGLLWEVGNAAD